MNSPIKWVGSKRTMSRTVINLIPEHTIYVEPFFGGGSIFFHKNRSKIEVINDQNDLLINFYQVVEKYPDELRKKFDYVLQSRSLFLQYRKTDWTKFAVKIDDDGPDAIDKKVDKAFRFYYLIRNAYCGLYRVNKKGEFNAPFCGATNSVKDWGIRKLCGQFFNLDWIRPAHERLKGATIECKDYIEILKKFDGEKTFFFMDPPYDTDYAYSLDGFDYDLLLDQVRNLKGPWLLTLNSELHDKFKEFPIFKVEVPENMNASMRGKSRFDIVVRSPDIERMVSAQL